VLPPKGDISALQSFLVHDMSSKNLCHPDVIEIRVSAGSYITLRVLFIFIV